MKITLNTDNMSPQQIVELFDALAGEAMKDYNDEVYDFRGMLITAATRTGLVEFNEKTGELKTRD